MGERVLDSRTGFGVAPSRGGANTALIAIRRTNQVTTLANPKAKCVMAATTSRR
jgi:hypothetical protein